VDRSRFNELISISRNPRFSTSDMLDLCRVEYVAPGDAAATNLSGKSIDYHTSYTVLEHIPPVVLRAIMEEGNRIMRDGGLFIHRIDYSDHFSHSDRSITGINFLQYSDEEWERYAGNRYMYMNRLRHDDYVALFETVGHRILATESDMDERSHALLTADQFHLDKRFSPKSAGVLAMSGSWIVTEKRA
jgi:hypothetical protein